MKKKSIKLFVPLSTLSIILLSTGCASKKADGTYASAYSYHSYLQAKENTPKPIKTHLRRTEIVAQKEPLKTAIYTSISKPTNTYISQVVPSLQYNENNRDINSNIEQTAKSLLGTDYQYGATGPYQYDCSSFTKYVFSKQGINIPRISRDQAKKGQFVTANQLRKGDLIFFDSKKSSQVSHVGIYLGGGNFIHASSVKDKVTISNLSSNYYSKHFKWGRRITNMNYAMRDKGRSINRPSL